MESTKDCEMLDHNITDPQFVMEQVNYVHITEIWMMLSRKRGELSEIRWWQTSGVLVAFQIFK